jgi:ribosome-associated protein YbcJ (S4-like RNA binding protein)
MKFWLKKGSEEIFLDQMLKAAGIMETYTEIKELIANTRVKVNDDVELFPKRKIVAGDVVKVFNKVIRVCGKAEALEFAKQRNATEEVHHSRSVNTWVAKEIKKK